MRGDWPAFSQAAALKLSGGAEDNELVIQLLAALEKIFENAGENVLRAPGRKVVHIVIIADTAGHIDAGIERGGPIMRWSRGQDPAENRLGFTPLSNTASVFCFKPIFEELFLRRFLVAGLCLPLGSGHAAELKLAGDLKGL